MRTSKTAKFGISLLMLIALFVSSASAACLCSHHQTKTETLSCHQTSHEDQTKKVSESNAVDISHKIKAFCDCFKNAPPFALNKSENKKTEKNAALVFNKIEAELSFDVSEQVSTKFEYSYHFYNSNYLKKLTPPRAPPVL
jgi:hypothetical protein